jgi:predicted HicB family RNase H-like nuclease
MATRKLTPKVVFQVRAEVPLHDAVRRATNARGVSITAWINEAIVEKLDRDRAAKRASRSK